MVVKAAPVYSVVSSDNAFVVQRDGAPMKTPAGSVFALLKAKLAEAIAAEWRAQKDKIVPASMPLTQLAATTLDITAKDRSKIIDETLAYAGSELLCHRADHPAGLTARQQQIWQPILDWCAERFKAKLKTGVGIIPINQSSEALDALRRVVESYDDFRLAGFKQAVEVSGSFVLGLALAEKHLSAEQVFDAAELDASFQIEKWGEDPALANRREEIKKELALCEQWFDFLRP